MDYEKFARYRVSPTGRLKNQARRFMKRSVVDLDLEDVLQAGAIGLMLALRKYDAEKARFTTYAAWWVLREMQGCAAKAVQVRRPKSAGLTYPKWREFEAFKAAMGEDPTDEDLALPKGAIDSWKQTPVFFPLDDEEEEHRGSFSDGRQGADEACIAAARQERLRLAVSLIPVEEMENLRRVSRGLRGDKSLADTTLGALRMYLEDF